MVSSIKYNERIIQFSHRGGAIIGLAIFNFRKCSDTVAVMPFDFTEDLGKIIFLCKIHGEWRTFTQIENEFPETFESILITLQLDWDIQR